MNQHHPYDPSRKAAPSSDLSARDEFRFWVPVSVVCLLALLAVEAAFPAHKMHIKGLEPIYVPIIGWVIGTLISPLFQPRKVSTPSWVIAGVALVLVAICAVAFPVEWTALARGVGGFIIGLAGGFLALRAWLANRG